MRGKQRLEIEDVPTPEPDPNEVLIKIKYNGLCGSDVHRFQYGAADNGSIMGHEYIGQVVQVGQDVTRWEEGDRVVGGGGQNPEPSSSVFGNARYSAQSVGFKSPKWGGFAEFVTMPEWAPSPIPDNVPDELAVLAEPCAIAVHAVRRSAFRVGDDAVVMGAGPIGLLIQQVLKAGGANSIYVSEPAPARADAAAKLGATRVFDPASENVIEEIIELTGGLGVPVAFDAAAAKPTLQQGLEMVRRGGQVLLVSMAWVDVPLLTVEWIGREVEMKAAYGSTSDDWQTVLTLMGRGQIDHKPMVLDDGFIGFDEMQESMERLMTPDEHIQLVLAP